MQSYFATKWLGVMGVLVMLLGAGTLLSAGADEIVVGGQCDRTGPTKFIGTLLCPGANDYIKLVNKKGGINGHTVRYIEVEHAYKVDRGVEAYERIKREGGVTTVDYGTPIVYALTPRHMEDKIPGLTPGFGRADAADGERVPYIFPVAASYWSPAAAGFWVSMKRPSISPGGPPKSPKRTWPARWSSS